MAEHTDERIRRAPDEVRSSRASESRAIKGDRRPGDPVRRNALVDTLSANILPDVPEIPGFHTCWLSTTSQHDPIYRRMQAGYTLVTAEDLPAGMHLPSLKTGDFVGGFAVNEMVLFKVPQSDYQDYMRKVHHEDPLSWEQQLKESAFAKMKDKHGRPLGMPDAEDEGFQELGREPKKPPTFAP